jgi:hypothetical protein
MKHAALLEQRGMEPSGADRRNAATGAACATAAAATTVE